MEFQDIYRSLFAILRFEGNNGKVVGTGFLIKTNPIVVMTCHHVVSEGNETNTRAIEYSITKRTDTFTDFDLRQVNIAFLRASKIFRKPDCDLAVLTIDPNENTAIATQLGIQTAPALQLSFADDERDIGIDVEWLTTATLADVTLTPRFFKGNIVSKYIANYAYTFVNSQNETVQQVMNGIRLLEIDKLFLPGASGSPILNSTTNCVIGYVHGFRSWPIPANTEINQEVELNDNGLKRKLGLKQTLPLITSLSLGIDIRSVRQTLNDEGFL